MPRKKRNTETAVKKAASAPVEVTAAETVVEPAVVEAALEKAAPAAEETVKKGRKPAAKKAETASVVEETPKKRSRKTTAAEKKASEENVVIQFMGAAVTASELVAKAKADCGADSPKTVDVYVKPEENMVYYVVDGVTGKFNLA